MRRISNVGWCWEPRCELCKVCTGRRLLEAQLFGVADMDCGTCEDWMAQVIPMAQVTDEQGQECLWKGQLAFCNGRIEFGLDNTFSPGDILLEASVYEIALEEGPSPPLQEQVDPGDEVLVGDWRLIIPRVSSVDCDFESLTLEGFTASAYTLLEKPGTYQHCDWSGSGITISKALCVDVEV